MFTKWYKQVHRARILQTTIKNFVAYDGSTFTYYGNNAASRKTSELALGDALNRAYTVSYMVSRGDACVSFGSGTTPPVEGDYKLESPLTDGVTFTPGTMQTNLTDEQDTISNTFMITNKGTEDITVSEVGIYAPASAGSNSSSTSQYTLMERTVFDPVTIPAGESATVKYEIVVTYPSL